MAAVLFIICPGGVGILALAIGLGMKKHQIAKAGFGFLLSCVILILISTTRAIIIHNHRLDHHPLSGTWICAEHCPFNLTFDDTTWDLGSKLTIIQSPNYHRDGVITSGSKTCDLILSGESLFAVNCGGNTADFQYYITGNHLTLNVYGRSLEFDRENP